MRSKVPHIKADVYTSLLEKSQRFVDINLLFGGKLIGSTNIPAKHFMSDDEFFAHSLQKKWSNIA